MVKLSNKQYDKLVKGLDQKVNIGDLISVICDAGLCPIPLNECIYYYSAEQDIVCPVLIEVCKRLKDAKNIS